MTMDDGNASVVWNNSNSQIEWWFQCCIAYDSLDLTKFLLLYVILGVFKLYMYIDQNTIQLSVGVSKFAECYQHGFSREVAKYCHTLCCHSHSAQ